MPQENLSRDRALARANRASVAIDLLARLEHLLEPSQQEAAWNHHVEFARSACLGLGLTSSHERVPFALEELLQSLEDQELVLAGLGLDALSGSWSSFVQELDGLAREVSATCSEPRRGGRILVTTPDRLAGVRVRHLVVSCLEEGTFPARDEILKADEAETDRSYGREMSRFLRLLSVGQNSISLVYPTTDEKGVALLRAGFLDEIQNFLGETVWKACASETRRLSPVREHLLCGSTREQRVGAIGRALQGDLSELQELHEKPVARRCAGRRLPGSLARPDTGKETCSGCLRRSPEPRRRAALARS